MPASARRPVYLMDTYCDPLAVGGWGDRQNLADRLSPVGFPVIVDGSSLERAVELRPGEIGRRLAKDLVGLAQLAVLPLKRLQPLGHIARHAGPLAGVNLRLLHPLVQRFGRCSRSSIAKRKFARDPEGHERTHASAVHGFRHRVAGCAAPPLRSPPRHPASEARLRSLEKDRCSVGTAFPPIPAMVRRLHRPEF